MLLFYRYWTRKEAVLKAQGVGLLKGLSSVDVAVATGLGPWKVTVFGEMGMEDYSVIDIEVPVGFAAALAFAAPVVEISVRHYGIREI